MLIQMGVSVLAAHFFAFFFACWSLISPPVAPVSATAATLAEANYWKTGIEAVKISISGYIVPFLIIYCPFLMYQQENILLAVVKAVACILLILYIQVMMVGYLLRPLNWLERALMGVTLAMLLTFLITGNYAISATGFIGLISLNLWHMRNKLINKVAFKAYPR
jgi:TRAP-type uncharacterized transport system fused permease subunit